MVLSFIQIIWLCVAGLLTLWLPGAAILSFFPNEDDDLAEQLGRIMGLSMAVIALGGLVTFLLGLHLSAWGLLSIYAGFSILGISGWLLRPRRRRFSFAKLKEASLLLLIGGGLLAWRWYQARTLVLPAWVDSVQHVLIVQAILKQGGITGNLQPYLSVPLYYHYGFHAVAAVFTFWSRLPTDQAILWFGQILEAAISLAIYRLGCVLWKHLGRERATLRGLAAALLVGLVTTMPGYYLTWGRYTLLAGLILLALAMAEAIQVAQRHQSSPTWPGSYLVFPCLVAAVLVTHYLAALFLAFFLVILFLPFIWEKVRHKHGSLEQGLPLVAGTAIGLILVLPWLAWVVVHALNLFTLKMVLPAQSGGSDFVSYLLVLLGPQRNYDVLALAGLGLILAFFASKTRVFAVWSLIFAMLCLPVGLRLGPLRPDIAVMMIFFPEVLLAGHLLISAGEAVSRVARRKWAGAGALALSLALLCIWGMKETGNILNPVTIFVDQADRQALAWIDQAIPADADFYINTALWQGTTYRGVDGGYWILPLTGRQTLLPPIDYTYGSVDYVAQINTWARQASQINTCSADFWKLVQDSGVTYIYVHQGEGTLQPSGLTGCDGIELIYQKNGVFIYKIH